MIKSILHSFNDIKFIGVMDEDGKVLISVHKYDQHLAEKEIEIFDVDMHIIRNIQEVYDESLGKVHTMIITRERVKQIVFYLDRKLVFISCNPRIDDKSLQELTNSIENYSKSNFE